MYTLEEHTILCLSKNNEEWEILLFHILWFLVEGEVGNCPSNSLVVR